MKMTKNLLILGLSVALAFLFEPIGRAQPKNPMTNPPVITHSFAVDKGYYGYIWKIYIEAEDPDGDMYENCFGSGSARCWSLPNRLDHPQTAISKAFERIYSMEYPSASGDLPEWTHDYFESFYYR